MPKDMLMKRISFFIITNANWRQCDDDDDSCSSLSASFITTSFIIKKRENIQKGLPARKERNPFFPSFFLILCENLRRGTPSSKAFQPISLRRKKKNPFVCASTRKIFPPFWFYVDNTGKRIFWSWRRRGGRRPNFQVLPISHIGWIPPTRQQRIASSAISASFRPPHNNWSL